MNSIREVEGNRIVTDGSTTCPSKHLCDRGERETQAQYIRRHCGDHGIVVGDFSDEECERNLSLYCLYFFHKYVIGNPTLCPEPFWEIHEFVANWTWSTEDLEQNVPMKERRFVLPEASERRAGEYRRYKQLEIPRQCQKTSTVTKAFVTQESIRQYFLFDNRCFRVIITSATSTLVVKLLRSYRQLWSKNQNLRRLFGVVITRGSGHNEFQERIALLGPKPGAGLNALAFRWLSEADDTSGMAAFSVMVAGVGTETTGQRADLYVFDDPATTKNSNTEAKRLRVKECFSEQIRQLDHNGRMLVCNTRKHLEDFGGSIHKEPLRSQFHTFHRKAEWTDAAGIEHLYYVKDGEGTERLSRVALDRLRASMTSREYSSEYLNEPLDESMAVYKRDDFQLIDPKEAPIEIRYGLGRDLTQDEAADLERERTSLKAYNHCDPAGKEDQTLHGDDTAIVGWRIDRYGRLYITYISAGQWDSTKLWDELYSAFCFNRPEITDYELPASEMHVRNSYAKWTSDKQRELGGRSADMRIHFEPLPKSGKPGRIDSLEPWARRKAIFILSTVPEELREKLIHQFVNRIVTQHDDLADAASRIVRFLRPADYQEVAQVEQIKSDFVQKDGVTSVPFDVLVAMSREGGDGLMWGQRGVAAHA